MKIALHVEELTEALKSAGIDVKFTRDGKALPEEETLEIAVDSAKHGELIDKVYGVQKKRELFDAVLAFIGKNIVLGKGKDKEAITELAESLVELSHEVEIYNEARTRYGMGAKPVESVKKALVDAYAAEIEKDTITKEMAELLMAYYTEENYVKFATMQQRVRDAATKSIGR